MDVRPRVCGSGDAGAYGVADAVDEGSFLLGKLDGSQRVGSLAALRNGYHHIVLRHDGVTVAELRGILHFAWDVTQAFEELPCNESGVPRRAASHDDDTLRANQLPAMVNHGRQRHMVTLHVDAPSHTVLQTLGLLEDFLQHEVLVAALLYLSEVDVHGAHLQMLLFAEDAQDLQLLAQANDGDVAVLQIDHLICVVDDGTGVGAQEELVLADAHYEWTLLACCYNLPGLALVDDGDGIGSYHLMECHLHGFEQRDVLPDHDILHELHQHLGVCVALELHAFRLELHLDVGIVLYDAIMDDGKILAPGVMRVSVACRRLAMRRPTRMGNAHAARHVLVAAIVGQVVNLSFGLVHVELAAVAYHCYSGTVVATILQTLQAFNQYRIGFLRSDVTYNSTHNIIYYLTIYN